METMKQEARSENLFFDWGHSLQVPFPAILDATLRDGIQGILTRYPSLDEKLHLVDLLLSLGVHEFEIGMPVVGLKHKQESIAVAAHIFKQCPDARVICLARTKIDDVIAVAEVAQAVGCHIGCALFVGSSPIRRRVEGWSIVDLVNWTAQAVRFAVHEGLAVSLACEDATRSEPETLRNLYLTAIEHGASRVVIPDTVGICSTDSTRRIVEFFRDQITDGDTIPIDWHGHNDRDLGVANAVAAANAGATCIHTTVLGIGERCGNVPLEPLLVHLATHETYQWNLSILPQLAEYASKIFDDPIRSRYPIIGQNAFATAAGTHGAALYKATQRRDSQLAANVYAGADPRSFGREVQVFVGPMSGVANVKWKAQELGVSLKPNSEEDILLVAKERDKILTDQEFRTVAASL